MAQNALDLDSTKVGRHFIKLKDVAIIDSDKNVEDALEIFEETNYSRLPVSRNGQLIGIVHLKDIFYHKKGKILKYFKTVPTVSINQTLSAALEKMRLQKAQMAFVTKTTSSAEVLGIITMEDILEEIIGEIYDEFDQEEWEDFFEISLELFHVSGKVLMKEIVKRLEIELELTDEELNISLKEFLEKKVNHKLRKNSRYTQEDVSFKVLSVNPKDQEIKVEIELGNDIDRIETMELNVNNN
ncbi:UNVERIFIED_CONTAM: CBS domain-containing protein [Campylobacter lari]